MPSLSLLSTFRFCSPLLLPLLTTMGLALGILLPWQLGSASLYPLQRGVQFATLGLLLVGGFALRRAFGPALLACVGPLLRWPLGMAALLMAAALVLSPHPGVALLELTYLMFLKG